MNVEPYLTIKKFVYKSVAVGSVVYIVAAEGPTYVLDQIPTVQSAGDNVAERVDVAAVAKPSLRSDNRNLGQWKEITVASSAVAMLLEADQEQT